MPRPHHPPALQGARDEIIADERLSASPIVALVASAVATCSLIAGSESAQPIVRTVRVSARQEVGTDTY